MTEAAAHSLRAKNKQLVRDVVLDAAERLLQRNNEADFSMRALAAEAGVGFATPFNHFGNKNAIMQALSSRLISRMAARFQDEQPAGDAIDRLLAMGRISVSVLVEKPRVHKAVIGSLGTVSPTPSAIHQHSQQLWLEALGSFTGLATDTRELARAVLADQIAFCFRGCVSFWIAGELQDRELGSAFQNGACALLLGFATPTRRGFLMKRIKRGPRRAANPGLS